MNDIEKNDVEIKKLFNWSDTVTVYDRSGNPVKDFSIKIVGEADWNRARVWALRDSSELRKKLKNKESDERKAFVQEREDVDKEVLVEYVLMLSMRDYTNEAVDTVSIPYPVPPKSTASLEQQEIYQAKIDKYAEVREEKLKEEIRKIVERERTKFNEMDIKKLHDYYETVTINELCRSELNEKFLAYCAYLGTYKTEEFNDLAFSSYDEFANVPTDVKIQIMNKYAELDMNADTLKK